MPLFTRAGLARYRSPVVSLILFLCCIPAFGDELWTQLFEENLSRAKSGDADAQYEVGIMYLKGQGVEPDRTQAMKWLNDAAAAGNAQATTKLRRITHQEEKFQELLKAAQDGDATAQHDVAMMYLKGQGIGQDMENARLWLTRAARQDDQQAITRLGILHYKGELGEVDFGEALRLFEQVSDDSVLAQYYLGEMYATGSGVEKSYATAIEWYQKAADGGFKRALGKIINLEEEAKMEQRRQARLEQKPDPEKVAAPSPEPQPEAVAKAKPVAPAKPVERKKPAPPPKPSALQMLAAKQWKKKDDPVEFLPSSVNKCEMEQEALVCFSDVLQRSSGRKIVQYRVKSLITSPDNRSFRISYRNLVLDVMVQEDDSEDQPPGYDSGTDQGFHIQTGWTREHSVECGALTSQGLECVKDKAHSIRVVEG